MSYFPDSVLKKLNNVLKPDSIKRYSYWLKDVSPEYSQSKLATFYNRRDECSSPADAEAPTSGAFA